MGFWMMAASQYHLALGYAAPARLAIALIELTE
jgi:hypothetical protein